MDNLEEYLAEYLLFKHFQVWELIDYLHENCPKFTPETELKIMKRSIAAKEELPEQDKKKLIDLIKEEIKNLNR